MIFLQVKKLTKRYGANKVLDAISLEQSKGVLGIAGSNGSGKSTLMKCLAGLERPTSGSVIWQKNNAPIEKENLNSFLGFLAPYISLYGQLTVMENLQFLKKLRGDVPKNHLSMTLQKVQALNLSNNLYGTLSTGQQQRVKLAAALFHQPNVLLLDEPGANLDQKGRNLIEDIAHEMKAKKRLVILASNQPMELNLCDTTYSVE